LVSVGVKSTLKLWVPALRTVPINGGGSFNVVYSGNHSGSWGAIVEDSVSSNCKFSNGKTTYKSVILGEGYTEQTVQVTGRNCIFSSGGNYNIITSSGVGEIKYFQKQTVRWKYWQF